MADGLNCTVLTSRALSPGVSISISMLLSVSVGEEGGEEEIQSRGNGGKKNKHPPDEPAGGAVPHATARLRPQPTNQPTKSVQVVTVREAPPCQEVEQEEEEIRVLEERQRPPDIQEPGQGAWSFTKLLPPTQWDWEGPLYRGRWGFSHANAAESGGEGVVRVERAGQGGGARTCSLPPTGGAGGGDAAGGGGAAVKVSGVGGACVLIPGTTVERERKWAESRLAFHRSHDSHDIQTN